MYVRYTKITSATIIFLLSACLSVCAQNKTIKANKLYANKAYSQAIPLYEKTLKKDSTNVTALINLADCYRLTNNTVKAEKYYGKIVAKSLNLPIHKYYYGQALIANGKYVKGKEWIQAYQKEEPSDKRATDQLQALNHWSDYFKDSSYFNIKRININSDEADFAPVIYKNGIVFTSSRPKVQAVNRIHTWTDKRFSSLYYSEKQDSVTFKQPVMFEAGLQTKFHDGPATFSKDYSQFYFTRNNIEAGTVKMSTDKIVKLKIYRSNADKEGKHFEKNITPFEFNNNDYHCAHPSLSADGTKLYFSSDMSGGKGGMDLYVCTKQGEAWGRPENLGDAINTKGNEVFPYIQDDGTLYFSSNGHDGIGSLDIYTVSTTQAGEVPTNMGYPINSKQDDFGIAILGNGQSGYFTSNRLKGNTDDDIYFFSSTKPKKQLFTIKVIDETTNELIENSMIVLKGANEKEPKEFENKKGIFEVELIPENKYEIIGLADSYKQNKIIAKANPAKPVIEVKLAKAMELKLNTLVLNNPKEKLPVANAVIKIKDKENVEKKFTTNFDGAFNDLIINPENSYTTFASKDNKTAEPNIISTIGQKQSKTYQQIIFLENSGLNCLSGTILNKDSNSPIAGAVVNIIDLTTGTEMYNTTTTADGKYKYCGIEPNKAYKVTADKNGYFIKSEMVPTSGLKPNVNLTKDIIIEPIVVGKAIKIDNIYFDLSKWNIRKDASIELDKIVKLLQENPTLVIELGSHTDCRSSKEFNMDLSSKRAKSSAEYIIAKGIDAKRITGKGYGETILVNKCECEGTVKVPCTEKEHQANRRTEFKVVGFIKDGTVILNP